MQGPEAIVHEADVDLGLVEIGSMAKSFFTLENLSPLQVAWNLSCADQSAAALLEFERDGTLAPLDKRLVGVVFKPTKPVAVSTQLRVRITDGNEM